MSMKLEPKVPPDLRKALTADANIMNIWSSLTPLARREYVIWVEQPRLPETRAKRIATIASRLAAGKRRPCCYSPIPTRLFKAIWASPKANANWKKLTTEERRIFGIWVNEEKDLEKHKKRVEKVVDLVTAGKRKP